MSNDGLTKLIKDLNDDLEYIDNQHSFKRQICDKGELERDVRFFTYCKILLDLAKSEREKRKT